MTRAPWWENTWAAVRIVAAGLIAAAVIAQAQVTFSLAAETGRDMTTTVVNFFSFFTILSNVSSVVVLAWASLWLWMRGRDAAGRPAVEPTALAVALASVSTYMIVTGIVYNTLLRNIELPQGTTVPWSNEVLHVVGPLVLLLDVFFGPRPRALRWTALWAVVAFPIVWVVYTLVRGPLTVNPVTGAEWWYPYPFLDPALQGGYGGVALYVAGIAAVIALVGWFVLWVDRRRAPQPAGETSGTLHDPSKNAAVGR